MKLMYEKILPTEHSSWRYWLYKEDGIPFNWHYHPEYEIVLTLNSSGQRYVGDHIGVYDEIDLVLVGPHVPHTWCSKPNEDGTVQLVYVAQLPNEWFDSIVYNTEDLKLVKDLLREAGRGIKFSTETANQCANLFINMQEQSSLERFLALMQMITAMVKDKDKTLLSSTKYAANVFCDSSTDKLDKIITYIHDHSNERIKAEDVARYVHMSTNHFHRFFKKRTEKTFVEVVNELRITEACSMLINTELPISAISDLCGFNNFSNFNRRFQQYRELTPSQFRKQYARHFKKKVA